MRPPSSIGRINRSDAGERGATESTECGSCRQQSSLYPSQHRRLSSESRTRWRTTTAGWRIASRAPSMQDIWANLLENAANPRKQNLVLASFPRVLKQLGSREAILSERHFSGFLRFDWSQILLGKGRNMLFTRWRRSEMSIIRWGIHATACSPISDRVSGGYRKWRRTRPTNAHHRGSLTEGDC